jgi:hypothetical protein
MLPTVGTLPWPESCCVVTNGARVLGMGLDPDDPRSQHGAIPSALILTGSRFDTTTWLP